MKTEIHIAKQYNKIYWKTNIQGEIYTTILLYGICTTSIYEVINLYVFTKQIYIYTLILFPFPTIYTTLCDVIIYKTQKIGKYIAKKLKKQQKKIVEIKKLTKKYFQKRS